MSKPKTTAAIPDWAENLPPEQLGRIMRPAEAAQFFGISRTTLWRYAREKRIPEALRLSDRARGWRLADLLKAQATMEQPAIASTERANAQPVRAPQPAASEPVNAPPAHTPPPPAPPCTKRSASGTSGV